MRRRRDRIGAILAALALCLSACAPSALAAPPKQPTNDKPKPDPIPASVADPPADAQRLGASGQVDPIAGLGIRNPACDRPAEIADRATATACRASGSPEALYPASNYGFDVFIDSGIDAPTGTFAKGLVMLLNGLWLGLIFVLKLVLSLLGLAFGLNPFAEGETMREISAALLRTYERITDPWLSTLIVIGGVWFAWRGLVKRDLGGSLAGTLAAIALLVLGIWVVHDPAASVGEAAALSDELALALIAAPQEGSLARPTGSYAEAMSATWARLVEVPFAGLDFSDVEWAMGPPPKEAVEEAEERYCEDVGVPSLLGLTTAVAGDACRAAARRRFGRPRRVIDLYLRSSPGSPSRQALWELFDGDAATKPKVAAQGGDGVLTRLSMVALFAVGLLGALLLLAWLAIRLFTQAAVAFVLVLAAPLALFLPTLGDAGRAAFRIWGLTLLGAILAKVIYAAVLAIVLLGIAIMGRVGDAAGPATGFLLSAAFTWALFLKRAELIGWLSVSGGKADSGALGRLAAFQVGHRIAAAGTRTLGRTASRGARWPAHRAADGARATRATARDSLAESARALGAFRLADARSTLATNSKRPPAPGTPAHDRHTRAQALVARADANQRERGAPFTAAEVRELASEDRRLLRTTADPAAHAHRAGLSRSAFESLQGPERTAAEHRIEQAIRRDRARLAAVDDPGSLPGRIAALPRTLPERARQSTGPDAAARRAHLARLRRSRRHRPDLTRRNLSRGA